MKDAKESRTGAPEAPQALQGLGLSEEQIEAVKKYVWARLRLGASLRTALVGLLLVGAAHFLMRQFVVSDPDEAVRSVVDVGVTEYLPYGEAAMLLLAVAMFGLVAFQLHALDRVLKNSLGLSARASAHVRRIARLGTLREAFGERVARLVVYGVVRDGEAP